MSVETRSYFVERDLRYVFSWTVELEMEYEEIGPVPGGARVNIFTKNGGEVFQVLNERSPWAENNIRGKVVSGADWAFLGDDDIGRINVRLAIKTEDHAYIEVRNHGVFRVGPGGYRELLRDRKPEDRPGTWEEPFVVPLYTTPTFETSHPRYSWLTKLQCVGFGNVKIVEGRAREATLDVYAMA